MQDVLHTSIHGESSMSGDWSSPLMARPVQEIHGGRRLASVGVAVFGHRRHVPGCWWPCPLRKIPPMRLGGGRGQRIQVDFNWSVSPPGWLDGRGGGIIRDLDVSAAASAIAIHPPVRDRLKQAQREVAPHAKGS